MVFPPCDRIDRRSFLRSLAVAGSGIAAGSLLSCEHDPLSVDRSVVRESGENAVSAVTTTRLRIPTTVSPSGLTLTAAPGTADLGAGRSTRALLFNGQFPGPTIVASQGSSVDASFVNQLTGPSIVHWHGVLAPPHSDGHPHDAVNAGASYAYPPFALTQRAGLCWYHPHPHGHTGEQVYHGLAGAFILRDAEESALGLPAGAHEIPLIIRDASFDSKGNFTFSSKSSGFLGNTPLVNGTLDPLLRVDAALYRFRILNGCNARVLRLALTQQRPFHLIGNDGGLLRQRVQVRTITMAPGERVDVLVDFRDLAAGAGARLRCLDAGWTLLRFRGTGAAGPAAVLPDTLSTIRALGTPVRTRTFSFDGMTRINGRTYDMARTDFTVPFGETELWRFTTGGNGPHPVHVHGAMFQVKSRAGGRARVYPWERGWKDTVLLLDGETVDVRIRFTAHRGLYVMHCHQLAHEDNGMMANFEVV